MFHVEIYRLVSQKSLENEASGQQIKGGEKIKIEPTAQNSGDSKNQQKCC
jgi:hypothetical protein